MIRLSELRLFNIVMLSNMDTCITVGLMEDILKGKRKVEPIKINEEWLDKFGFEKIRTGWLEDDCDIWKFNFFIWDDRRGLRLNGVNQIRYDLTYVKYIHQLQNLYFALTGTELIFADKETKE